MAIHATRRCQLFLRLKAMINFFFASRWFLCLTAILPAHVRLTVFFTSRWFAFPGNIIINLASPGQYHHQFGLIAVSLLAVVSSISPHRLAPLDNIIFCSALLAIFSSILPHGRAPPAILFSIQPNSHAILAKYFSIRPHGCASPGKILLITHQGFLRAAFLQAALAPIPTWFFKASFHRLWCCLSCNAMQQTAFCILSDALTQGFCSSALVLLFLLCQVTNSVCILSDAHSPGWWVTLWPRMIRLKIPLIPQSRRDASWVGILWISTTDLLNWLFKSLFRSEVSHSCDGPIPGQHTSFKYRYKSFKRTFKKSRILFKSFQDWIIFLLDNYEWSLARTILLFPHSINVPD